jgi:hypothetical protein
MIVTGMNQSLPCWRLCIHTEKRANFIKFFFQRILFFLSEGQAAMMAYGYSFFFFPEGSEVKWIHLPYSQLVVE